MLKTVHRWSAALCVCVSSLVLLIGGAWTSMPAHAAGAGDGTQLETICQGSPVPTGWVVINTNADDSSSCAPVQGNGYHYNVETIVPAVDETTVCSISPIPQNWVVIKIQTNVRVCWDNSFPNILLWNQKVIAPASGASMTICGISDVPDGWVVTGEDTLLSNPGAGVSCAQSASPTEIVQKTIIPVISGVSVCQDSPVPAGYQTDTIAPLLVCHADTTSKLVTATIPSGGAGSSF